MWVGFATMVSLVMVVQNKGLIMSLLTAEMPCKYIVGLKFGTNLIKNFLTAPKFKVTMWIKLNNF